MKRELIITAIATALAGAVVIAQSPAPGQPGQGNDQGRGPGHRPPPPIMAALDANHDGVIDATEIANAANALKTLDKNNDGKLTRDELMPPGCPGGPGGRGGRHHRGGDDDGEENAPQQ